MGIAIAECVHSERDRLILRLRLIDGWTYEAIAEHPLIDRTPRHVATILETYTGLLFDFLKREEQYRWKIS